MVLPEPVEPFAHPFDVVLGAQELEAVELRNGALACDNRTGQAVGLTEVGIARGDDPAQQGAIVGIVEEKGNLARHRP